MSTLWKHAGRLVIVSILFTITACTTRISPATPTPTTQPTSTKAPTHTPRPTSTPRATSTMIVPTLAVTTTLQSSASTIPVIGTLPTASLPSGTALPTISAVLATSPASALEDKYAYISQNLPDTSTQVKPGTPLTIIWTVKNAGKTEWTTDYTLRFFAGPNPPKTFYNFPKKVAPGEQVDLSFSFTAPDVPGTYNTWWKLTNDKSQNFGDVNFTFVVTNTPGESPTSTPES